MNRRVLLPADGLGRLWLYAGWKVSRRELSDQRLIFRKIA